MIDHHLWQMLLALMVIFALSRGRWSEWGFNFRNAAGSLQLTKRFCVVFGIYFVGVGFDLQLVLFTAPESDCPPTPANLIGRFVFMALAVGDLGGDPVPRNDADRAVSVHRGRLEVEVLRAAGGRG